MKKKLLIVIIISVIFSVWFAFKKDNFSKIERLSQNKHEVVCKEYLDVYEIIDDEFINDVKNYNLNPQYIKSNFPVLSERKKEKLYSFEKDSVDTDIVYGDEQNRFNIWKVDDTKSFLMSAVITSADFKIVEGIHIGMQKDYFEKYFNGAYGCSQIQIGDSEGSVNIIFTFNRDVLVKILYKDIYVH
jgi:hypothetical protein